MILTLLGRSRSALASVIGGLAMTAYVVSDSTWRGQWEVSAQLVCNALVLALPGYVLAGAVDARQTFGSGLARAVRRPNAYRLMVLVAASCAWPVVSLAILQAIVLASDLATTPLNPPPVLTLVLPYLWITLATTIGWALGTRLSLIVVTPLAALLGFLLPVLLASEPGSTGSLFTPIDDGAIGVPYVLQASALAIQACILVLLISAAILTAMGLATSTASRPSRTVVGALPVTAAALLALAIDPDRSTEITNAPGPRTCKAEVCVWSDHVALLNPTLAAWKRLSRVLPSRWQERPRGLVEAGLAARPGALRFSTGTAWGYETELAFLLASELVDHLYCPAGQSAVPGEEPSWKRDWLLLRAGYLRADALSPELKAQLAVLSDAATQETWWLNSGEARCFPD